MTTPAVAPKVEASASPETPLSPETPEETQPEEGFEEPDFSALAEFVDRGGEEEEPEGSAEVEAAKPKEEAPAPVSKSEAEGKKPPAEEEPKPEETPAVEPSPEPAKGESEASPKEEAKPEVEPPETKVPTKEELEGMYEDFRKESMPVLEKLYQMDEKLAAAYDESPKEVLPKLAAQIHYEARMSSYNAVMAAVPSVVGRYMKAVQAANTAEGAFFEAWPQLSDEKYTSVVRTAIQAYRTANPTAKLEDVVDKAGTLAMIHAGIELKPEVEASVPAPKKAPAKPVGPGAASQIEPPVKPSASSGNVFEDLSEDWDKSRL